MAVLNSLVNIGRYYYLQRRYRNHANKSPLGRCYQGSFPSRRQHFLQTKFLVVDCEMSGLNPDNHQLLSIGWVAIEKGRIQAASAEHLLIQSTEGAGDSVLIHGLHDHMLAGGNSITKVLALFARHAQNRVLVFHHAPIDLVFLQSAAHRYFHAPFLFPYLDTLEMEKNRMQHQGRHVGLRLQQCRERYALPPCPQHNALTDAQATAELFLAQAHYRGSPTSLTLADFPLHCS